MSEVSLYILHHQPKICTGAINRGGGGEVGGGVRRRLLFLDERVVVVRLDLGRGTLVNVCVCVCARL
jgi:hypothetical protein